MPVHLLGTVFQTMLTLFVNFWTPSETFSLVVLPAQRAHSKLFTVNALYKLLTYLHSVT